MPGSGLFMNSGMKHFDVLIVGSGHGGAQAAILLRQLGFSGSVGVIGAEPDLPYERPPLSKDYLAGEKPLERLLIRPETFWAERDIEIRRETRIVSLDPADPSVLTHAGEILGYSNLIWAAGGTPRRLTCKGVDLEGVHVVRCRAEVDRIRGELASASKIAIIGGGYIGLETAAVLRALGKAVTLIEAEERLLSRVAAPDLSAFFKREHRFHGVEIRLGEQVASIEGSNGRIEELRTASGERIQADMAIVGIGIVPEVAPLLAAGAEGTNGVNVDAICRTTLPNIYAIGDCAAHENRFADGARVRLESVQNAHGQAATAVRSILGAPQPYEELPWFWSNQYDLKLQTVGLSMGYDRTVLRGDPDSRSFSVVYLRRGQVTALDCVNATRDYAQGRKLILAKVAPDLQLLANPDVPLKSLAGSQ